MTLLLNSFALMESGLVVVLLVIQRRRGNARARRGGGGGGGHRIKMNVHRHGGVPHRDVVRDHQGGATVRHAEAVVDGGSQSLGPPQGE